MKIFSFFKSLFPNLIDPKNFKKMSILVFKLFHLYTRYRCEKADKARYVVV